MIKNIQFIVASILSGVFVMTGNSMNAQVQAPTTLCNHVIVGYWHSFDNQISTVVKLRDVPCYYNVVNISFFEGASPSDPTVVFRLDEKAVETEAELISDIKILKSRGQKVMASIGGANGAISLPDDAAKTKFVNSISGLIDKFGIEGLDIDIEGGAISLSGADNDYKNPTTPVIKNMISAFKTLKAKYGSNFWISAAPEVAYVQGGITAYGSIWGAYLPIIYGLRNELNFLQVQYYNAGGNTASDGNSYNQGTADFIVAMSDMLLSGFKIANGQTFEPLREDQVAFGLPSTTGAAPAGGYLALAEVTKALDYLTKGSSFGGKYKLSKSFPNLRGIMTWSVNWDNIPSSKYAFGKTFAQYFCGSTNLCSATTNIGENKDSGNNLHLYPNPSSGLTSIEGYAADETTALQIFTIYGTEVYSEAIHQKGNFQRQVDLSAYASGVYFIKITSDAASETKRILLCTSTLQ
jgi:chitinase